MRVAHLIDSLDPGGAQALLVTLARAAAARDLRLTMISLSADREQAYPAEIRSQGVPVMSFPAHRLLDVRRLWRVAGFLRRERFDVLHAHLTYATIVGALSARLSGTPLVVSLHNTRTDRRHYHPLRERLERWALRRRAQRIIAVGHTVAAMNRDRVGGRPLDVVLNAVEPAPSLGPTARTRLRAELTGDPARPLLIAVGRLSPQKGYADLLAALAILREAIPAVALAIAGEGVLRADLEARIAEDGLREHAFLLGRRTDVPCLLAASDVFVSASHWEGLPIAVLEAMAAGLPVVVTNVGDVPQVLRPETGLAVPPHEPARLAQTLDGLLRDPERRHALGTAARAYVLDHHNPAAWVDQLLAIYSAVGAASASLHPAAANAGGARRRDESRSAV